MKTIRKKIDAKLVRIFPKGSWLKRLVLKLFLRNREKVFFSLIAPDDSVRTNADPGYLYLQGWWQSFGSQKFTDGYGEAIPWFTYPAIAFLKERISGNLDVLEYGSGNSTLFWAQRCKSVTAIEHDEQWYHSLLNAPLQNIQLHHQPLTPIEGYCKVETSLQGFHIIVIDGRNRVACCKASVKYLRADGVVILDDSHREKYIAGVDFLKDAGFKRINFWGLRHQSTESTCTALFYQDGNCLGI